MAEGDEPGVADQDVGGHREQAPDQDLGQKPAPELGQDQRRHRQQRHNKPEPGPIGDCVSVSHFGVGTKSPVGRNRRGGSSTTEETRTAWDGATNSAAKPSNRRMKSAARIEPPRLPMPPTTTTIK